MSYLPLKCVLVKWCIICSTNILTRYDVFIVTAAVIINKMITTLNMNQLEFVSNLPCSFRRECLQSLETIDNDGP